MRNPSPPATEVPINIGNKPDWITRLGFPSIRNFFVGESGFLYSTPALAVIAEIKDCRALHFTTFDNGFYVVVTNTAVFRVNPNGAKSIIAEITFSGLPVQIDENLQNQIIIVDGAKGYVLDQRTGNFVTLGELEGFTITSPCSVLVLNTFAIVGDSATGTWIVSDPNNALVFPPLDAAQIPAISTQLTKLVSLETLNDNLYIFGLTGIERWQPNYNVNPFLFPFSKDNNFRIDYGAISTNSVIRGLDVIYFLSNRFTPMALTEGGAKEIVNNTTGIARIMGQYKDVSEAVGSFYSFFGNDFFHLTFPITKESWVYTIKSSTWAFSDDLVIGADRSNQRVLKSDGLYNLSLIQTPKRRIFQGERMTYYKGQQTYRAVMQGFEVRMVQGLSHVQQPEYLELSFSIDSLSFLNVVKRPIGNTGQRNAICTWGTNIAAYEFTPRVAYYGDLDLTIEKMTCYIK